MPIEMLQNELRCAGRRLSRWQAGLQTLAAAAAWLAALWLFGLADLFLHLGRAGRVGAWTLLLGLAAAGLWLAARSLARQRTRESVAAQIERAFPQLDNHLINCVQLAGLPRPGAFERAYLRRGVPEWSQVDLRQMRDRRSFHRAWLALGLTGAMLLVPALWSSRAWGNALARIVNPFSARPPSTLAVIVNVSPGDTLAVQGAELVLRCEVEGRSGQEVWLDLWPADDKPARLALGKLRGRGAEPFDHKIPRVAAGFHYRFGAGDARSDRFRVTVAPPLALASLDARVSPPAYTGLRETAYDALADKLIIPRGSTVELSARWTRAVATATVRALAQEPVAMTARDPAGPWSATLTVLTANPLKLRATAADGETLESELHFQLLADRPPEIRIIAPTGRTTLPPGTGPRIRFEVLDDYGLTRIQIEQAPTEEAPPAPAADDQPPAEPARPVLEEWTINGERFFSTTWRGEPPAVAPGQPAAYRVVAFDNLAPGQPHHSFSPLIIFETTGPKELVNEQARAASETAATLARLVQLQSANLERTRHLDAELAAATFAHWKAVSIAQIEIRDLTGQLLVHPAKPLGFLTERIRELYQSEMAQVIEVLDRVPRTEISRRAAASRQAIALQTRILRALTNTSEKLEHVERHRQLTGVLAMLDALVAGQDQLLGRCRAHLQSRSPVLNDLVKRQDRLAGDLTEFVEVCRSEARLLHNGDPEFARLLLQVADACQQRKVAADMLRAAEHLENNAPGRAVPLQEKVLAALKEFQALLNQWRVQEAVRDFKELKQLVAESKEKFEKLAELQTKLLETMRGLGEEKDLSGEDLAGLKQELQALKDNIREAALKTATDLHIFPNLPVGNELVEDIFHTFEEAQQVPGSEDAPATELGLQKEDQILELLENAAERMDDMEMWLAAAPDNVRRLTENFDQEELPAELAVTPMPEALEDIIGDLLQQQEDIRNQSDDSATNQGAADLPAGWDIAEGEYVSFGAKGKSGNEPPEHAEQTGRSLVGRQGMSDGETTAATGAISEGDPNIENRRTQDPFQAGEVHEESNADAIATGGGKQSGVAHADGMPGHAPRRDANHPGSEAGLQAMLRRDAEAIYAQASLLRIRTGSLDEALTHMRKAEQAIAQAHPIQQVREHQRRAVEALKRTQIELGSGAFVETPIAGRAGPSPADQLVGAPEEAPAEYRELVAEYYKSLSAGP
jgi:cellobiose-specific phosphotransferase system component IIA